jgi:hypothetical protein
MMIFIIIVLIFTTILGLLRFSIFNYIVNLEKLRIKLATVNMADSEDMTDPNNLNSSMQNNVNHQTGADTTTEQQYTDRDDDKHTFPK